MRFQPSCRQAFRFLFLLIPLLFMHACAPPWHGEEDNFPVCVLALTGSGGQSQLSIAESGVTRILNLEHGAETPLGGYFAQPHLNFDSRLDDEYDFVLPLDKESGVSTFVIFRDTLTDTLELRYTSAPGVTDDIRYDFELTDVHIARHTFDTLYSAEPVNHPLIHLLIRAAL